MNLWLWAFGALALVLVVGNLLTLYLSARQWPKKLPPALPWDDDERH
ncbi:MAG: hypothetical protein II007_04760 [Gammaproteobacteria bacterium]|nr:hypothetical protein [Gammaproteobacteria bacterium]